MDAKVKGKKSMFAEFMVLVVSVTHPSPCVLALTPLSTIFPPNVGLLGAFQKLFSKRKGSPYLPIPLKLLLSMHR